MENAPTNFSGSASYWEQRYRGGGDSGAGSYGRLADFKAEILNRFVASHTVESVIEFGSGDGNQLSLARYPSYIGLDVSASAIQMCKKRFAEDSSKSFFLYQPDCFVDRQGIFASDLAMSLDVIYHLVEDRIFDMYMRHLFGAGRRFVAVYSTNEDSSTGDAHVKHRQFTRWVEQNAPAWRLLEHVPNRYPFHPDQIGESSNAEFFFFAQR